MASERHVRVEFRNMVPGEKLGPFRYSGDLVVTCYRGRFALSDEKESRSAIELDQVVVPENSRLEIECIEGGTIQDHLGTFVCPNSARLTSANRLKSFQVRPLFQPDTPR